MSLDLRIIATPTGIVTGRALGGPRGTGNVWFMIWVWVRQMCPCEHVLSSLVTALSLTSGETKGPSWPGTVLALVPKSPVF